MALVITLLSTLLFVFQLLLLARAVLDWSAVLVGPPMPGSLRSRLTAGARAATEPVLAPVRRVLPPLRIGSVALDLAFIVVFIGVIVLRRLILFL